jgi:peptidoglycan hydrolase FlgJ
MSIFPQTDIVSDVARAADPQKLQAATKRLESANASRTSSPAAFAATSSKSGAPTATLRTAFSLPPDIGAPARANRIEQDPAAAAAKKFEAFVLQSWLEVLLPKEESGAFGSGGAGNVWRSMMAEQLGAQIASAGGFGLQKLIAPATKSDATKS